MADDIYVEEAVYSLESVYAEILTMDRCVVKLPKEDSGGAVAKLDITFYFCVVVAPSGAGQALLRTPYLYMSNCGLHDTELIDREGLRSEKAAGRCIRVEHPTHPVSRPTRVDLYEVFLERTYLRSFSLERCSVKDCVLDDKTKRAWFFRSMVENLWICGEVRLDELMLLGPPPMDVRLKESDAKIFAKKVRVDSRFSEVEGSRFNWGDIEVSGEEVMKF